MWGRVGGEKEGSEATEKMRSGREKKMPASARAEAVMGAAEARLDDSFALLWDGRSVSSSTGARRVSSSASSWKAPRRF